MYQNKLQDFNIKKNVILILKEFIENKDTQILLGLLYYQFKVSHAHTVNLFEISQFSPSPVRWSTLLKIQISSRFKTNSLEIQKDSYNVFK